MNTNWYLGIEDEESARRRLEMIRWPRGVVCVHCGSDQVTALCDRGSQGKGGAMDRRWRASGQYKCRGCRRKFSVITGTFFERTHLPLHRWIKTLGSLYTWGGPFAVSDLQSSLEVSYATAWKQYQRIDELLIKPLSAAMLGRDQAERQLVSRATRRRDPKRGQFMPRNISLYPLRPFDVLAFALRVDGVIRRLEQQNVRGTGNGSTESASGVGAGRSG